MADLVPGAWRDRPALIERVFPSQKLSVEAQAERKANAGQTLTALGSYWKGRKPLVLVRACVLGALMPASSDLAADLRVFEQLMAIDDHSFEHRVRSVSRDDVRRWGGDLVAVLLDGDRWRAGPRERAALLGQVLRRMPYVDRLDRRSLRPEELPPEAFDGIWSDVNAHLGTSARSLPELVDQMGILRFGHRPVVADRFGGGGSVPFEAARVGCNVHASDLNPIACLLTWGGLNLIGAPAGRRANLSDLRERVIARVEAEVAPTETRADGLRAKAYLYCAEVRCPQTGWLVPLLPSLIISRNKHVVARLRADPARQGFHIDIVDARKTADFDAALVGTFRDGDLVYTLDGVEYRSSIAALRGDRREGEGWANAIRPWERGDVVPRDGDVFQERLYCIQWHGARGDDVVFAAPTDEDIARERAVLSQLRANVEGWQDAGFIPDTVIEPGRKTEEPIRTRGWTHWHHLFTPRSLVMNALYVKHAVELAAGDAALLAGLAFDVNSLADRSSRLSRWEVGYPGRPGVAPSADAVKPVFYNQALNTLYSYAARSFAHQAASLRRANYANFPLPEGVRATVTPRPAADRGAEADLHITDPPYADAVEYAELSEFFIAWQRGLGRYAFPDWVWDSRRKLAIHGDGDEFRTAMVRAYGSMAGSASDGGLHVVMFTHQSGAVWADMALIFWGAGLQVLSAWYIATETSSELKKGGYVQGTVILTLRRRAGEESGYKDEIIDDVKREVAQQIETMVGLNQSLRGAGRIENLFEDADLQMAGYAAALRVLTSYVRINGQDMTREAQRPRSKGEDGGLVAEIIDFAVQVANEHLVPEGLSAKVWERLSGAERFYLKMLDIEAAGARKLDNYQNFAKAFRCGDFQPLMQSMRPNDARLKRADELKRGEFGETEFGRSAMRALLYALLELQQDVDADAVLGHLRDLVPDYHNRRGDLADIAAYIDRKRATAAPDEAKAARILHALIRNERLGS